jgi:vancomycin resistance protein YoaR
MTQRRANSRSAGARSRSNYNKPTVKNNAPSRNKRSGGGGAKIGWVLLALIVIVGVFIAMNKYKEITKDTIADGVVVDGINLSGMTPDEAYAVVQNASQDILNKMSITLRYGEKSWHFGAQELQAVVDTQKVIDEAYQAGREGNVLERYKTQQDIKSLGKILNTSIKVNRQVLFDALANLQNEIDNPMIEASVTFDPSNYSFFADQDTPDIDESRSMFTITEGKVGYVMDYEKAVADLEAALANGYTADITITAKEARPKLTRAELEESTQLLFHSSSKISSGNKKNVNRNSNIKKAIGFYKGLVVQPGEIISYNEMLGERTEAAGWLEAPTITQEKTLEDALGGGICQASTTIFNAAFMAGTKIIDRGPHSWPAYYQDFGMGMDAMVNYGTDDFIFQNTSDYPLYFNTYLWTDSYGTPGYIDVDVYGMPEKDEQGNVLHIRAESIIEENTPPSDPIYKEDVNNEFVNETWKPDTTLNKMTFVYRHPRNLIKVRVYRVWYKDCVQTGLGQWEGGTEVKREESHLDLYKSVQAIIYTKPMPVVPAPTPEPAPPGGASG